MTFGSNIFIISISHPKMNTLLQTNTVIHSNGKILTGKLWRKTHSFFKDLPFYSNIPRMDGLVGPLANAGSEDDGNRHFLELLRVRSLYLFIFSNLTISFRNLGKVWMTFTHFQIPRELISSYARQKGFFPRIGIQLGQRMHRESGVLCRSS